MKTVVKVILLIFSFNFILSIECSAYGYYVICYDEDSNYYVFSAR